MVEPLQPAQTLQIKRFVGGGAVTLRLPDAFSQAFRYAVFHVMRVGTALYEPLVNAADAGRSVCGELFLDGDVQAHVQERIALTRLWRKGLIEFVGVFE